MSPTKRLSIRIPREQLGAVALQTLHEMLTKPAKAGTESILETELARIIHWLSSFRCKLMLRKTLRKAV